MHAHKVLKLGAAVCAVSFLAAASNAAVTPRTGRRTTHLLNDMQYDARQIAHHAQVMENLADHTQFSWDTEGLELRSVRTEINDMGNRLGRLQAMENAVAPSEQQAIQRLQPLVEQMAQNADAAIQFRNSHHSGYWAGPFMTDVKSIHAEANTLVRTIHRDRERLGA